MHVLDVKRARPTAGMFLSGTEAGSRRTVSGMKTRSFPVLLAVLVALSLVIACATLPENVGRKETFAYPDTGDTLLGREISRQGAAHPGESGFHLLGNGLDAFVARAALAHLAERSIDVQYYLYHADLVGRLLTWLLLQAADRGVRVRLLVDDMDLAERDLVAAALDSHPNVEVRIFNPFSRKTGRVSQYVTRMGSVTRRMHNKSFTVDSQATILGGRNIGNEYFEANPDLAFATWTSLPSGRSPGRFRSPSTGTGTANWPIPYRSWSTSPRPRKKSGECGNS